MPNTFQYCLKTYKMFLSVNFYLHRTHNANTFSIQLNIDYNSTCCRYLADLVLSCCTDDSSLPISSLAWSNVFSISASSIPRLANYNNYIYIIVKCRQLHYIYNTYHRQRYLVYTQYTCFVTMLCQYLAAWHMCVSQLTISDKLNIELSFNS